ncbi:MAG: hypothetical protein IJ762_01640 [Bacteroidaceae bacterium]|nr:hypothetical protein [Bacteroidaceae bacterium]
MKRLLGMLQVAMMATTLSAQTILMGDTNGDDQLTISDVTSTVNMVLGKSPALNVDLSGMAYRVDNSGVQATCQVTVSDPDSHEYVDLGLPSGTLWATCNIGADSPEDYGDYFAWGETTGYNSGKTNFAWSTYKYCNGSPSTLTKYCTSSSFGTVDNKAELELSDDAAYVNWGSNWRMPSDAQFTELINSSYTTTTWTTQNGKYGRKITSKSNGNSIFLPAAGYRNDTSLYRAGSYGNYWSRTLYTSGPNYAHYLFFISSNIHTGNGSRYYGRSVRPVRASQ